MQTISWWLEDVYMSNAIFAAKEVEVIQIEAAGAAKKKKKYNFFVCDI